jgi:hypothetical protein
MFGPLIPGIRNPFRGGMRAAALVVLRLLSWKMVSGLLAEGVLMLL